ncbi:F-box only protein 36 isoform X2 [Buteo buteo]|uniref:F-box only protein 36 isoform X2 n=1 Tax=Buteo buteo TaxID=30397 RepID=UPI003EBC4141
MASLLGEEVFETRGQAPAPSKDFCQLLVTRREVVRPLSPLLSVLGNLRSNSAFVLPKVIFRWWKISLRNEFHESRPGEIKESQEDFLADSSLHIQIAIVFGAKVLEHVLNLCRGNYDFLERLPVPLLLYIISFLELEDIARLSQVSRRFEMEQQNGDRRRARGNLKKIFKIHVFISGLPQQFCPNNPCFSFAKMR